METNLKSLCYFLVYFTFALVLINKRKPETQNPLKMLNWIGDRNPQSQEKGVIFFTIFWKNMDLMGERGYMGLESTQKEFGNTLQDTSYTLYYL